MAQPIQTPVNSCLLKLSSTLIFNTSRPARRNVRFTTNSNPLFSFFQYDPLDTGGI